MLFLVSFQGHNTDGKYFINSNKMSFHFETSPKRVVLYIEKSKDGHVTPIDGVQVVDFACGNNHTVRFRHYFDNNLKHFKKFSICVISYRLQSIQRSVHTVGALVDSVDLVSYHSCISFKYNSIYF